MGFGKSLQNFSLKNFMLPCLLTITTPLDCLSRIVNRNLLVRQLAVSNANDSFCLFSCKAKKNTCIRITTKQCALIVGLQLQNNNVVATIILRKLIQSATTMRLINCTGTSARKKLSYCSKMLVQQGITIKHYMWIKNYLLVKTVLMQNFQF